MRSPKSRYVNLSFIAALFFCALDDAALVFSTSRGALTAFASDNETATINRIIAFGGDRYQDQRELENPCQTKRLEILAGGLIKLIIDHGDIPITVSILSPDSKSLLSLTATSGEPLQILFIAPTPGSYRLEAYEIATNRSESCFCRASWLRDWKPRDRHLVEASHRINEGNNLASVETSTELEQALRKYETSLKMLKPSGVSHEVTELRLLSLSGLGRVLNGLNQFQSALPYLQQASDLARSADNAGIHARVLVDLTHTYLALGDASKAAETIAQASEIAKTSTDAYAKARARQGLADFHYELNDYQLGQTYGSEARKLFERLRDRRGYTHSLLLLGLIASDLNMSEKASSIYKQALSASKAIKYRGGVIDALTYSGHLAAKEGRLHEAVEFYIEAEQLARQLGDVLRESWVTSGLAYVYDQSGDSSRALEYYKRTLKLRLSANNKLAEASIYRRLGAAYFSLMEYQQAAFYLTKAAELYEGFKQWRYLAATLRDLGALYEARGEYDKAIDHYARSKEFMGKGDDSRGMAYLLVAKGRLLEKQGKFAAAFQEYSEALKAHRSVKDRRGESQALFHLSMLAAKRGQTDDALAQLEETIRNDENFRSEIQSPELRASHLADVRKHYESYIDLLMRLHKNNPTAGFDIRALETSESARARSLLDSLYGNLNSDSVSARDDSELITRAERLKKELSAKVTEKSGLMRTGNFAAVATLDEEINQLADAYERTNSVIRSRRAQNSTTVAKALRAQEIQAQLLNANELLLEYALTEERSYVWAITKTTIEAHELPDRKTIEDSARAYYAALSEFENIPTAKAWNELTNRSTELGRILLRPVLDKLANKLVIVVADGALHLIPFYALSVPTADGRQATGDLATNALIQKNEIVYLPSASVLSLLRVPDAKRPIATKQLAVLADPVFSPNDPRVLQNRSSRPHLPPSTSRGQLDQTLRDAGLLSSGQDLPRLLASRWEADAISTLAGGQVLKATDFQANLNTALNPELQQYRMIHFATHGVLNTKRPSLSGIVFSLYDENGKPQAGYLRAIDVFEMNLAAELVTLSSCQTAVGKEFSGEGMVGLSRAFMQAGTKRVVASLWKVDDVATSELMTEFYKGMLNDGLRPAAALRRAQIKLSEKKRWRSPYYWAGFVLQGEWN